MLINFDRMPAMHLRHKTQKALTTCLIVTLVFQHVAVSCAGCLSANPCSSSPNQVEHVELGSSCPGCGCCQIATNATDCPCCKQKPTKRSASKPKSCCVSSSEAADEDAAREAILLRFRAAVTVFDPTRLFLMIRLIAIPISNRPKD